MIRRADSYSTRCKKRACLNPDLFVFTNVAGVCSMEVNVFQRGCDVRCAHLDSWPRSLDPNLMWPGAAS